MSSNNVIYTTGPLAQNRQVSQQFQSFNARGAPVAVSESRITMFASVTSAYIITVLSLLWTFIAASVTGKNFAYTSEFEIPGAMSFTDLCKRPSLVITVPAKISEAKKQKLINAGFGEQTNGRYRYYKGPPTNEAMMAAIDVGCATDAFAPGNTVSVDGLMTFSLVNRVFSLIFQTMSLLTTNGSGAVFLKDGSGVQPMDLTNAKGPFTEKNLSELPEKGFFFGYFDGLLLPDRVIVPRVMGMFSGLLGKNANKVKALQAVTSGWLSLSDTAAGREFSHMAYCIEQSIRTGATIRPVYLNGVYCGTVFNTETVGVMQGNTFIKPQVKEDLEAGIKSMQTHDSALSEIAAVLSSAPLRSDKAKTKEVLPESIEYTRDIHNFARERHIDAEGQRRIQGAAKRLKFQQTLWEVTNARNVMMTIGFITRGEFPDRKVPMNMFIDAIWSTSPIYSALAAYTAKAPSLRGDDSQLTKRVAKDMYTFTKPGTLVGIPIFGKSHSKALEDWQGVLEQLQVWFGHKGADSQGHLRIKGLTMSIPFATDEAKTVMNSLAAISKKRKVGDDKEQEPEAAPSEDDLAKAAAAKRRKLKGFGFLPGFLTTSTSEEMEVDGEPADVDPFA